MARRKGPARLALADYSDRELLIVVEETVESADDAGGATSVEIAAALGMTGETPQRHVGSRLAYLRRIGLVEREPETTIARWSLSPLGRRVAFAVVDPETAERLKQTRGEDRIMLARMISEGHRRMPEGVRQAMRREFRRANGLA